MTKPTIELPIRLEVGTESVAVVDRLGTILAYVYFEDEPERQKLLRRLSKAQAIQAARIAGQALRAAVDAGEI